MPEAALITEPKPPPGSPCPGCRKPRDQFLRCWKCFDRPCETCHKPTGSAFIRLCVACGAAEDTPTAPDRWPGAPKRWIIVFEAKKGVLLPLPRQMARLLKHWGRYLGMRCVAFPGTIPAGTLIDYPVEDGADDDV